MTAAQTHILVTTDFSEESFVAFGPAEQFAGRLGARITLLYVLPEMGCRPTGSPFVSPVRVPTAEEQVKSTKADLEQLRSRFATGIEVQVDTVVGPEAGETIARYAEQHDVDLIVIGTNGRSGLRRLVVGSVAEQVLRHSQVPVLVVPRPAR